MRLTTPALLSLFGIMLLAPPSEAARTVTASGEQARFSLTADGYAVSVEGSGRQVVLSVEHGLEKAAVYQTRGTASPDRIKARFGHFGRVSVRFKPTGRTSRRRPPKRCDGRAAIIRSGVFVGTIRFRGEDRYISIDAHRAKGRSSTMPRWRCGDRRRIASASARKKQSGFEAAELEAVTPHEGVFFAASGFRAKDGPGLIFFVAGTVEQKGSVRIARFALVISGKGRTFFYQQAPRSAKVQPPKPFHGSARFEREAGGGVSWTGDLSVSLPGATVELTGPRFKAKLARPGSSEKGRELSARLPLLRLGKAGLADPETFVQSP
jgi:hypothetical protein